MERGELVRIVECLLFASDEPLEPRFLAKVAGCSEGEVEEAARTLSALYEEYEHGLKVEEVAGSFRLVTRPEYASYVERLGRSRSPALSVAALETLAIIAYRQPVTRAEIEAIRGVRVEGVLGSLLEKGLVREVGRKDAPGKPILYGTTKEFLTYFGLKSLSDLPDLNVFSASGEDR